MDFHQGDERANGLRYLRMVGRRLCPGVVKTQSHASQNASKTSSSIRQVHGVLGSHPTRAMNSNELSRRHLLDTVLSLQHSQMGILAPGSTGSHNQRGN